MTFTDMDQYYSEEQEAALQNDPYQGIGSLQDHLLVNPVPRLEFQPGTEVTQQIPFVLCMTVAGTNVMFQRTLEDNKLDSHLKRVFVLNSRTVIVQNSFPCALAVNITGIRKSFRNALLTEGKSMHSLILFPQQTGEFKAEERREQDAMDRIMRWGNLDEKQVAVQSLYTTYHGTQEMWTIPADHPIVYMLKINMSWLGPDITSLDEYVASQGPRKINGVMFENVPVLYRLPKDACLLAQEALKGMVQTFNAVDLTTFSVEARPAIGDNMYDDANRLGAVPPKGPAYLCGYVEYTYISAKGGKM